jgi:hypothetical protein
MPADGGEDQGGMGGESAGDAGNTPGGSGGSGGVAIGGRGIGGRGVAGSGFSGFSGAAGSILAGSGGAGSGGAGSGGIAGASGSAGGPSVPCGFYDCLRLPHVRLDADNVECQNGVCVIPQDACEQNYTHCTTNFNVGCETYLGSSNDCGVCGRRCTGGTPVCVNDGSGFKCGTGCSEPSPDRCGFVCTDLDTDPNNCGQCFVSCWGENVEAECRDRMCVADGPCNAGFGDCDGMFGCETLVNTPENCGACGRNNCGATNASPECTSLTGCVKPTCNDGYGNCNTTSPDCESTYGASCFPTYAGTRRIALTPNVAAVAPGGSFTLGGAWEGEIDFDASIGVDRLTSSSYGGDAYVTRYDANGTYSWTRAVAAGDNYEAVVALAMAADGSTIAAGSFYGVVDLDPGAGTLEHDSNGLPAVFISKLGTNGTLTWARVIMGIDSIGQLSTDASGAVYAAGSFQGQVDLDPGTGQDVHQDYSGSGFLLKLDASGNFAWSRLVDGESQEIWFGVSVAPDGSVWGIGRHYGSAVIAGALLPDEAGAFIAGFEPTGALRRLANLEGVYNAYSPFYKLSAGTDALHVSGPYQGSDLDPGAGVVNRYSPEQSAFVVHLSSAAAYREAHVFPSYDFPELAGSPSGVLVGARGTNEIRAFSHDGTSSWTMRIGDQFGLGYVVSSSTHFIVLGGEYGAADYDPGPGTDVIYGSTLLATRYAF